MKTRFFLTFLALSVLVSSCDKLKKDEDFRDPLVGKYKVLIERERFTSFPDPPAGIFYTENKEIEITKGSKDSSIVLEGKEYVLGSDYAYFVSEGYGQGNFHNFERLAFYTKSEKDSIIYQLSSGDDALYEILSIQGAHLAE